MFSLQRNLSAMGSKKKGHRADPQASTSGPTDAFTTPGMAKLGCSLIVPPGARFKLMTGRIDARTVVDKVFPNRTREIQYPGGTVWVLEQSEGAGLPHVHVLAGAVQVVFAYTMCLILAAPWRFPVHAIGEEREVGGITVPS